MPDPDDYQLGEVSKRYESSSPGTISTGVGDHGGVSYGTYQLSTAMGTLDEYLKQSAYGSKFKGLTPNTSAFNGEWRALASTDPGFARDQQNFIKNTHYVPQLAALKADGLDLSSRGPAVQEAIWSTSVQYRSLTGAIFENGLRDSFGKGYKLSELTDKDIVSAIQDYKVSHVSTLFRHSPSKWNSLTARAESEKADLIALAEGKPLPERSHGRHARMHESFLHQGVRGETVAALQTELASLGYTGSHGHAIRADGDFGRETLHAVEAFQRDHGLTVDGLVGAHTQAAIRIATDARKLGASVVCDAPAPLRTFSDSTHPQHALYNKLQGLFPEGTSDARLAQATAACHAAGMKQPDDLGNIYGNEHTILFTSNSPFANMAEMDVSTPAPAVQQSLQQIQQFDQQQVRAQPMLPQQSAEGPVMHY